MARCIRGIRGEELSGCVYFGWHVTYPPQLEDTALGGRMQPGAPTLPLLALSMNYPGMGPWP